MQNTARSLYLQWTDRPSLVYHVLRFLNNQGQNAWGNTERFMYTGHLDGRGQSETSSSSWPFSDASTDAAASFASLSGNSEVFNLHALD